VSLNANWLYDTQSQQPIIESAATAMPQEGLWG
jgi:hypothetical protein